MLCNFHTSQINIEVNSNFLMFSNLAMYWTNNEVIQSILYILQTCKHHNQRTTDSTCSILFKHIHKITEVSKVFVQFQYYYLAQYFRFGFEFKSQMKNWIYLFTQSIVSPLFKFVYLNVFYQSVIAGLKITMDTSGTMT